MGIRKGSKTRSPTKRRSSGGTSSTKYSQKKTLQVTSPPKSVTSQAQAAKERAEGAARGAAARAARRGDDEEAKRIRASIEEVGQAAYNTELTKAQKVWDVAFEAERKHKVESSRTTAKSEAIKAQDLNELRKENLEQQKGKLDPKTGGVIYDVKLQDSVKISDSVKTSGGGKTFKRNISDSVSAGDGTKERARKPSGKIVLPSQVESASYQVMVGSPNVQAQLLLKPQEKVKSIGTIPLEFDQPISPPKYQPGEATLNVFKEYALVGMDPTPIKKRILRMYDAELPDRITESNIKRLGGVGPTLLSSTITQLLKGEELKGTGRGPLYDIESATAEAALVLVPTRKIPLKYSKFDVPGVKLVSEGKNIVPKSLEIGFGTKKKPVITKEGSSISLGGPKLKKVEAVTIEPITPKQKQRGVKLAADSTQFEQKVTTNVKLLEKVEGLPKAEVKKAENVLEIIKIGSKSKDPVRTKRFEDPVGPLTMEETKKFAKSVKGQQTSIKGKLTGGRLSPYEGSASQMFFIADKYKRSPGDFDFHVKSFELGKARVKQTVREVGYPLAAEISEKNKSTKISKENKKVAEFLNPKETDKSGVLQMVEGDTLFTQKIPSKTYKVDEGVTFDLQRQFLKKGESVFSYQPGGTIGPVSFRAQKDLADFWAIGKTKAENLAAEGKTFEAAELEKRLAQLQKDYPIDYEGFFKKPETDTVVLGKEKSLASMAADVSKDPLLGSASASVTKSKLPGDVDTKSVTFEKSLSSPFKKATTKSAVSPLQAKSATSTPGKSIRNSILIQESNVLEYSKSTGKSSSKSSISSPGSKSTLSLDSPGSPSIGSPLSPGSPGSPSVGSPGSPGSPGRSPGGSILSIRSPATKVTSFGEKKPIVVIGGIWWKTKKSKGVRKEPKKLYPFIGNVPLEEVVGVYGKKREIKYGQKSVDAFEKFDIKETKKRKSSKVKNFLSL